MRFRDKAREEGERGGRERKRKENQLKPTYEREMHKRERDRKIRRNGDKKK